MTPTDEPTGTSAGDGGDRGFFDVAGVAGVVLGALALGVVGVVAVGLLGAESGGGRGGGGGDLPDLGPFGRVRFRLAGLSGRISETVMNLLVNASAAVPGLLDAFGTAASGVMVGLSVVARGALRGTVAALGSALAAPALLARGLGGAVFSLSSGVDDVDRVAGGEETLPTDTDARDPAPDPEGESGDAGPPDVEGAWAAMAETVPVDDPESTTPREFARAAVDAGYPVEPVRTLTRLFEEVTYGGLPSTDRRLAAAREALDRLQGGEGS